MIDLLQQVRFLVLYPVTAAAALVWSAVLWWRWRRLGAATDFWGAQIGLAVGAWAGSSMVALWVAERSGFGVLTAWLTTVGVALVALATAAAAGITVWRLWRRGGV